MKKLSNTDFEVEEGDRRPGDVDISTVPYESKYFKEEKTLEDMCLDALKYEV